MPNFALAVRTSLLLATLVTATPTSAVVIDYLVGDIDSFGGVVPNDNRSTSELNSTNGAQYTDLFTSLSGVNFNNLLNFQPLNVTFDIDRFASINSIEVSMFTAGIQDNVPTSLSTGAGDNLLFDGNYIEGYFDGVDQNGGFAGVIAESGLVTGNIAAQFFDDALDEQVVLGIALNSVTASPNGGILNLDSPNGEPAAFDYFQLTIDGVLADPIDGDDPVVVPDPNDGVDAVVVSETGTLALAVCGFTAIAVTRRRRKVNGSHVVGRFCHAA